MIVNKDNIPVNVPTKEFYPTGPINLNDNKLNYEHVKEINSENSSNDLTQYIHWRHDINDNRRVSVPTEKFEEEEQEEFDHLNYDYTYQHIIPDNSFNGRTQRLNKVEGIQDNQRVNVPAEDFDIPSPKIFTKRNYDRTVEINPENTTTERTQKLNNFNYSNVGNNPITNETESFHKISTEEMLESFTHLATEFSDGDLYGRSMPIPNYNNYVAGGAHPVNPFQGTTVENTFHKRSALGDFLETMTDIPIFGEGFGILLDGYDDVKKRAGDLMEAISDWNIKDMSWDDADRILRDWNEWLNRGGFGNPRPIPEPRSRENTRGNIPQNINVLGAERKLNRDEHGNHLIPNNIELTPSVVDVQRVLDNRRSKAIEHILNSGADYIKNMYDAVLVCYRENIGEDAMHDDFFTEVFKSKFLGGIEPVISNSVFMIRTASISVPQMESDTYEIPFAFEKIKKIKTSIKYTRKASLKILLDEPLYFMGVFNLLSNNNRIVFDGISENNRHPQGFTPFTTNKIVAEYIIAKKIRIDLIIKHQQLLQNPYLTEARKAWRSGMSNNIPGHMNTIGHAGLLPEEMPLWWFEDIKFLGQDDGLQFNMEKADIQEMGFSFIFKRCIKIDRQFRFGTEQTRQFADHELKDKELRFIEERSLKKYFGGVSNQDWYFG